MSVLFSNNARSLLATSIKATDTSIRVRAGHGSRYPQPSAIGDWFPLTIEDENGNIEILKATGRQGDLITVQRGVEGTQPRAFTTDDVVELRVTAAALYELKGNGQLG
jgi:hypothetical protein